MCGVWSALQDSWNVDQMLANKDTYYTMHRHSLFAQGEQTQMPRVGSKHLPSHFSVAQSHCYSRASQTLFR